MRLSFSKYHGTGNDFIMVDGRGLERDPFTEDVIRRLCDRRFGIGADGMIFLEDSPRLDFTMRYFNSDGKEGSMCGNGGRCITAFARDLGIIEGHTRFEGIDGEHEAAILDNGEIRLKLIDVEGIEQLKDGYLLNTGSPHYVRFVTELENLDVEREGRQIRHEQRFGKEGVNVNFVERMHSSAGIRVRTFERGVEGETWSCGTGVTAAAISASFDPGTDKLACKVHTRGGNLEVTFKKSGEGRYTDIYLAGPASHVYDGTIEITV
jgi:diaminopimelate epimerase